MKHQYPPLARQSAAPDSQPGALASAAAGEYHGKLCPLCGAHLVRLPRNAMDHVISALLPMRRYACKAKACDWRGLLRHHAVGGEGGAATGLRSGRVIEPALMQVGKRS